MIILYHTHSAPFSIQLVYTIVVYKVINKLNKIVLATSQLVVVLVY